MGTHDEFIRLNNALVQTLESNLKPEHFTPTVLNLVRGGIAAREQAFYYPESKELFLKFMDEIWEFGIQQRSVCDMDTEGSVSNKQGVVLGTACMLVQKYFHTELIPDMEEKS